MYRKLASQSINRSIDRLLQRHKMFTNQSIKQSMDWRIYWTSIRRLLTVPLSHLVGLNNNVNRFVRMKTDYQNPSNGIERIWRKVKMTPIFCRLARLSLKRHRAGEALLLLENQSEVTQRRHTTKYNDVWKLMIGKTGSEKKFQNKQNDRHKIQLGTKHMAPPGGATSKRQDGLVSY